jgi:lysine 2,3-aminomutase
MMFDVDADEIEKVRQIFPMRVNRYYLGLIRKKDDPIWKQVVPDIRELTSAGYSDPLHEEEDSPVSSIVHRYPDRVLFYVNHQCPVYCRFCTRKRKVGDPESVAPSSIEKGLEYIRKHPEIRDVILSGGDPLLLPDSKIDYILTELRRICHIEIIRIGSRVPCALPQRVTPQLCSILRKYHPLYLNTHFNHPNEITPESAQACARLADAGVPLGNQSVLLRGVNDDPEVMRTLLQSLLAIRVKPYYLYQADLVMGTDHFRTPVQRGLEIIESIRGFTSGLCVPHYVVDAPGGGGKIALIPDPVVEFSDGDIVLRNYENRIYRYPSGLAE